MDQKRGSTICCLQEIQFKYKDTYRLEVDEYGKIYHVNTNQKKAEIAILILEQISEQGKFSGIKRDIAYIMINMSILPKQAHMGSPVNSTEHLKQKLYQYSFICSRREPIEEITDKLASLK